MINPQYNIPELLERKLSHYNEEWAVALACARNAFAQGNADKSNTGMFWKQLEDVSIEGIRQFYDGGTIVIESNGKETTLSGASNIIHAHFVKFPNELNTQVKEALLYKTRIMWERYAMNLIASGKTLANSTHFTEEQKKQTKQALEDQINRMVVQGHRKLEIMLDEMLAIPISEEKSTVDIEGFFVDPIRIAQLSKINHPEFDLSKLVALCKELNIAYKNNSIFSIAMLMRALIDHVPPIFGQKDFDNVVSQYGTRSFKEMMAHLSNSMRKVADISLHTHVRKRESIPTGTQVRFQSELDLLLGEIHVVLRDTK